MNSIPRILQMVTCLNGGGVEKLMFNYCTQIIPEVQFDFIVIGDEEGILEKPLIELGCSIFHIPSLHQSIFKHIAGIARILATGDYDILHIHAGYKSIIPLIVAKYTGVKTRIAHAHFANIPENRLTYAMRCIISPFTKHFATDLFACGIDAGKWNWGKSEFTVIPNAINIREFSFSEKKRTEVREKMGWDNVFVIGNVARHTSQKNLDFLIEIYKEIDKGDKRTKLVLVGEGELDNELKERVSLSHLEDNVEFLGLRNDVASLIQGFDTFVLPSKYEGLPVVLIEVQANGLPAVVSNTITEEVKINDNVEFLSLDSNIKEWAKVICKNRERENSVKMLCSNYNIDNAKIKLIDIYRKLCTRER